MSNNWLVEMHELERRIADGTPEPSPAPTHLPWQAIQTVEGVFQHRAEVKTWEAEQHIKALATALRQLGTISMEPVEVFWIGDAWALIDGHHRMGAFELLDWSEPVPVKVFRGTLKEAQRQALAANSRAKLTMSRTERTNAGWRLLVADPEAPERTVMESAGVSKRQVVDMRKIRNALAGKFGDDYLGVLTWKDARRKHQGLTDTDSDYDDSWRAAAEKKLASRIREKLGSELTRAHDITCGALERYSPHLWETIEDQAGPRWLAKLMEQGWSVEQIAQKAQEDLEASMADPEGELDGLEF